jgi:hypothetical protein
LVIREWDTHDRSIALRLLVKKAPALESRLQDYRWQYFGIVVEEKKRICSQ